MYKLLFPKRYKKHAQQFLKLHPELQTKYIKTLQLLELNPHAPSLRLHQLHGKLSELHSVSINIAYRITIYFMISEKEITLVDIGTHDQLYR